MDWEPDDFEEWNRNEADDYRNEGEPESQDEEDPTDSPSDLTRVFVWDPEANRFRLVTAEDAICDECGASCTSEWEWEYPNHGFPYLTCGCGQQFYQTRD